MARKETVTATEHTFTAVFEPAEEGGYVVTFAALPGLVTEGDTLEDARTMAADAIRCYIEGFQKDGLAIPTEDEHTVKLFREKVTVKLAAV